MNEFEDIANMVCTFDCPLADDTCPFATNKEDCEKISAAVKKEELRKAFMQCLKFTCDVFQAWEEREEGYDVHEWLLHFLMPMTENRRMGTFMFYFFQAAYQMGLPVDDIKENTSE